jgi:DedD protein
MFDTNPPQNSLDSHSTQLGHDPIERLRRQAKQRFIGAAVLVLLAIGVLPLFLDSQPRPIASTVAIDIPKMDSKQEPAPVIQVPQIEAPLAFASAAADGQRAQALLNDTTAEAAPTTKSKYVVQAGSFSDPEKLHATAAKLDKAGIKHYTQAAVGKDGTPRTRLRLKASFVTKEEANAAAAQVAKLGIPVIVLKP